MLIKKFVTSIRQSPFLLKLVHLIVICQFFYALYYDYYHVKFPDRASMPAMLKPSFGGKFKFLTYWCLIIQGIYFTICIFNDFIGTNNVTLHTKNIPPIRKLRDYIFATFAFPLALTVGSTFWILMAIDRELVLPKAFDAFFPTWLNHVMHTNIVIFIVLEMFICSHTYPARKRGLIGLTIFMASYLIWVHIIKLLAGVWVYPLLEVLNIPQRLGFYVVVLSFCASLYFIGEFANNKIWHVDSISSTKSKSKKNK